METVPLDAHESDVIEPEIADSTSGEFAHAYDEGDKGAVVDAEIDSPYGNYDSDYRSESTELAVISPDAKSDKAEDMGADPVFDAELVDEAEGTAQADTARPMTDHEDMSEAAEIAVDGLANALGGVFGRRLWSSNLSGQPTKQTRKVQPRPPAAAKSPAASNGAKAEAPPVTAEQVWQRKATAKILRDLVTSGRSEQNVLTPHAQTKGMEKIEKLLQVPDEQNRKLDRAHELLQEMRAVLEKAEAMPSMPAELARKLAVTQLQAVYVQKVAQYKNDKFMHDMSNDRFPAPKKEGILLKADLLDAILAVTGGKLPSEIKPSV